MEKYDRHSMNGDRLYGHLVSPPSSTLSFLPMLTVMDMAIYEQFLKMYTLDR